MRGEVGEVLKAAAIYSELTRGAVFRLIGKSERTGRNTPKDLSDEGLLISDSAHGTIKSGFPAHAAAY